MTQNEQVGKAIIGYADAKARVKGLCARVRDELETIHSLCIPCADDFDTVVDDFDTVVLDGNALDYWPDRNVLMNLAQEFRKAKDDETRHKKDLTDLGVADILVA